MRKLFTLLFTIIIFQQFSLASFDPTARGGRSAGMGGTSVSQTNFWSVFNNPAAISFNRDISAGLFVENRFLMKELNFRGLGVILPIASNDAFGLQVEQFGHSQYLESKVGLSYSKKFADRFAFGLQFDYLNTNIGEGLGTGHNFTFDLGIYSKLSEKISMGFTAFNPIRSKLTSYNDIDEYIPIVFKLGAHYKFSDVMLFAAEVEKDIANKAVLRFGADYKISEIIYARAGISTGVVSYSFGVGVFYNSFCFDLATAVHQILGPSPQISLHYTF
ncbi:MAG: hypothetical protein GX140_05030 [Bacteroidales bacterium]|jgi:hypothetical protein|nr:hypothetical protein [Bacteroidales bacterium]